VDEIGRGRAALREAAPDVLDQPIHDIARGPESEARRALLDPDSSKAARRERGVGASRAWQGSGARRDGLRFEGDSASGAVLRALRIPRVTFGTYGTRRRGASHDLGVAIRADRVGFAHQRSARGASCDGRVLRGRRGRGKRRSAPARDRCARRMLDVVLGVALWTGDELHVKPPDSGGMIRDEIGRSRRELDGLRVPAQDDRHAHDRGRTTNSGG